MEVGVERALSIPRLMLVAVSAGMMIVFGTWIVASQNVDLKPAKIASLLSQLAAMYFTFDGIRRLSLAAGAPSIFTIVLGVAYEFIFPVKRKSFECTVGGAHFQVNMGDIQSFHFGGKDTDINRRFELVQAEIERTSSEVSKVKFDLRALSNKFSEFESYHNSRYEQLEASMKESENLKNKQAVIDGCKALACMFLSAVCGIF